MPRRKATHRLLRRDVGAATSELGAEVTRLRGRLLPIMVDGREVALAEAERKLFLLSVITAVAPKPVILAGHVVRLREAAT